MKPWYVAPVAFLLGLSLFVLACGGGDDDGGNGAPPEGPTGVVSVDTALVALDAHDGRALATQVVLSGVACTTADGVGGPPKCASGEANGTEVQVLAAAACEGYYLRPDEVEAALANFVTGNNVRVHSVYQQSVPDLLPGDYIVLLTYVDQALAGTRARELFLTDAGITGVFLGCSTTVAQLQQDHGLTNPILTR